MLTVPSYWGHTRALLASAGIAVAVTVGCLREAGAADDARAALSRQIETDSVLHRLFANVGVTSVSNLRADVAVNDGEKRSAIVVYKASLGGPDIGEKFCHAALSRNVHAEYIEALARQADRDTKVAALLFSKISVSIRFGGMISAGGAVGDGWYGYRCAAQVANTEFSPAPEVSKVDIFDATYQVGKSLVKAGKNEEAIDRFRRLRESPAHFPNAVLYLIVLMKDSQPTISEGLRKSGLNIDAATDLEALEFFAQANASAGFPVDAAAAQARCKVIGGCMVSPSPTPY